MLRRMFVLHGILLVLVLTICARLIELQILKSDEYHRNAQNQHFRGVTLPARRGEILALNSKTDETTILATNTTLDLIYVDPYIVDNPTLVAELLSDTLLTEDHHQLCTAGNVDCPRELVPFYEAAFDPLRVANRGSGTLLEPLPADLLAPPSPDELPDLTEARRLFARDIERRISEKRMTFVPFKYGATKPQMEEVRALNIVGVTVDAEQNLIYGNPEEIDQSRAGDIARVLSPIIDVDPVVLESSMRSRFLRYVPVMRRLAPAQSLSIKQQMLVSMKATAEKRSNAATREEAEKIQDPLRSIALIPEHWRFYPDGTLASQVVGFLNTNREAQYGIERTYEPQLRGQEGLISTVKDLQGGQILTAEQTIIDPKDGDSVTLTIDPFIQKGVEAILQDAMVRYSAESAQAIVMDPKTGRILAMVNTPLFERNNYGSVYEKEPIRLRNEEVQNLVVEVFHPTTNARILRGFYPQVSTPEGRKTLSEKLQQDLAEVEKLYDLPQLTRYYKLVGENARVEVFPTEIPEVWLKYKNTIGVGAYLNRTIQEIYEPGSVMKPITMAIAIDQGEIMPDTIYNDDAPVQVDEYTIKNALLIYYGKVTMTNCLEFSINTCMTNVGERLGKKLFHRMLERFGFGRITGVELDDELPGEIQPWRDWSDALLATTSFGQGISSTPLQMITAFAALSNGGMLLKPTIIDEIRHIDGTVERTETRVVDKVITTETSQAITAMLVSSIENGYAKTAKVNGYKIAGKTGTSQIAGPGGRYEAGTGSTVASFVGYAPADDPKFIALVKFDRPKNRLVAHGAGTAAPTFKEIATFLFKYYGIPPEDER